MPITNGPNLNAVPAPQQQLLQTNYIDFTSGAGNDWGQQYLPDLMEKEAEVFGNRTISGFLSQVGAEESMSSDQVIWTEQGRLHLSYIGTINTSNDQFTVVSDIDGNIAGDGFAVTAHGLRIGDMVLLAGASATQRCYVSAHVSGSIVTLKPYDTANVTGFTDGETCTILVFGSEFAKGTNGYAQKDTNQTTSNTVKPHMKSLSNKPVIIKDRYEISGSDAAQIGWVEVSGEEGQSGYLWYLKAEGDTRARFTDHLEMTMVEAIKGNATNSTIDGTNNIGTNFGTEGLFAAVEDRGNIATGILGTSVPNDLAEFDAILAEFDKQGAIEENMIFVNRTTALAIDDMLAGMNSYGAGGTSYGVFNNSEDMALNLGFSGFRRGSYDFYKSDWKYLNDKSTRGSINERDTVNAVRGIFIPAGVTSVYDQQLGKNLKRPFLHVRYRASKMEDRKFKTWITGSVGGNITSDLDAMEVHYLSERCLVVQGANNFMLLK